MDELLQSFTAFKEAHKEQHREMSAKLQHLEKEMVAGQEGTAQLMARKLKKTPGVNFKHRGNEKQFLRCKRIHPDGIWYFGEDKERASTRGEPTEDCQRATPGRYKSYRRAPCGYPPATLEVLRVFIGCR